MNRFQQGSLFKAKRKGCSDVCGFRWYDYSSGKRIYKKEIIGSVAQLRSRREAEKAEQVVKDHVLSALHLGGSCASALAQA